MTATVLEIVEAPTEMPEDESNLLHVYCAACLAAVYPERILPYCGTNRPRNDDEMGYPDIKLAPQHEICVVCHHSHCTVCGP